MTPSELSNPKSKKVDRTSDSDFLAAVRKANTTTPPSNFREGGVTPRTLDAKALTTTRQGFVIELPSKAPVPTPAIFGGRVYTGGGFSCEEFYCFDAKTGELVWGVDLDDDGPSIPVASEGTIIFNTESCTIFALDAETGNLLWSHWLGDPLMSAPTASSGRVYAVYPADDPPVETFQHVVACFELRSGKVLWQRWVDSDCITAPIVDGDELWLTTVSGTLYHFGAVDGAIHSAQPIRATCAPVVVDDRLFITRRTDPEGQADEVSESLVCLDPRQGTEQFLAIRRAAPYLDWRVQERAESAGKAGGFEGKNGIEGGMGGGFGALGNRSVDGLSLRPFPTQQKAQFRLVGFVEEAVDDEKDDGSEPSDDLPPDKLAATERLAMSVIGQGGVRCCRRSKAPARFIGTTATTLAWETPWRARQRKRAIRSGQLS